MMEWLFFLLFAAAQIIPMWKLCERGGLHPFWSLVCLIPLGLVVLLWILAFWRPKGVA